MVIQPLIGNPYNGYISPYYWVDDHPLLYGNNGSLDPGTYNNTITLHHHYKVTPLPVINGVLTPISGLSNTWVFTGVISPRKKVELWAPTYNWFRGLPCTILQVIPNSSKHSMGDTYQSQTMCFQCCSHIIHGHGVFYLPPSYGYKRNIMMYV